MRWSQRVVGAAGDRPLGKEVPAFRGNLPQLSRPEDNGRKFFRRKPFTKFERQAGAILDPQQKGRLFDADKVDDDLANDFRYRGPIEDRIQAG